MKIRAINLNKLCCKFEVDIGKIVLRKEYKCEYFFQDHLTFLNHVHFFT